MNGVRNSPFDLIMMNLKTGKGKDNSERPTDRASRTQFVLWQYEQVRQFGERGRSQIDCWLTCWMDEWIDGHFKSKLLVHGWLHITSHVTMQMLLHPPSVLHIIFSFPSIAVSTNCKLVNGEWVRARQISSGKHLLASR